MERGEDSAGRQYLDSSGYTGKNKSEKEQMLLRIKELVMIGRIFNAAHEGKGGIEGRISERRKEVTEDRFHCLTSFMCANRADIHTYTM